MYTRLKSRRMSRYGASNAASLKNRKVRRWVRFPHFCAYARRNCQYHQLFVSRSHNNNNCCWYHGRRRAFTVLVFQLYCLGKESAMSKLLIVLIGCLTIGCANIQSSVHYRYEISPEQSVNYELKVKHHDKKSCKNDTY